MGFVEDLKNVFIKNEKAIIVNNSGDQLKIVNIRSDENVINAVIGLDSYKGLSFELDRDKDKFLKIGKKKYYVFNTSSTRPLNFRLTKVLPPRPENLNAILSSRVLTELNTAKKGIWDKIDFKMVLLVLGIIAIAIYFLTGGSLT